MELKTYSASKLKTHNGCARRYWYSYIQKEPSEDHPAAAMGSAVHKTIEYAHKMYDPLNPCTTIPEINLQKFIEEYHKQIEERGIEFNQKYYNDGAKIIMNYVVDSKIEIKRTDQESIFLDRQPDELEIEFTLPFPNIVNPICYIHGYIDHLYHDWGFADLKTNRNRPLLGVLDNDLQFIIYDWAYQQIYGVQPLYRLWIHLRSGEVFESRCGGKLDLAIRAIERIQDSEITGIYDMCVGDACRICPFTIQCLGR